MDDFNYDFGEKEIKILENTIAEEYAKGTMNEESVLDYILAMKIVVFGRKYMIEEIRKNLKRENKKLKEEIKLYLNTPLMKEIKSALTRIDKGEFVGEDEFFEKYIQ